MITVTVRSSQRVLGRISVEPQTDLVGRPWSDWEQAAIAETLKLTDGNREATARILRIGPRTVYRKVEKYNLENLCRQSANPHPFTKNKKEK